MQNQTATIAQATAAAMAFNRNAHAAPWKAEGYTGSRNDGPYTRLCYEDGSFIQVVPGLDQDFYNAYGTDGTHTFRT